MIDVGILPVPFKMDIRLPDRIWLQVGPPHRLDNNFFAPFKIKKSKYYLYPMYFHIFPKYKSEIDFVLNKLEGAFPDNAIYFQRGDARFIHNVLPKNAIIIKHSSGANDKSYAIPYQLNQAINKTKPIDKANYDICFIGHLNSNNIRRGVNFSFKKLKFNYEETQRFWHQSKELQNRMLATYNVKINDSKFMLCPSGRAFNTYRFFEALKIGRIPILLEDQPVKLPFAWKIDYNRFVIRASYIEEVEDKILNFAANNNLIEISREIQSIYENELKWNPRKFIEEIIKHANNRKKIII